jgi:hypothetical protein
MLGEQALLCRPLAAGRMTAEVGYSSLCALCGAFMGRCCVILDFVGLIHGQRFDAWRV